MTETPEPTDPAPTRSLVGIAAMIGALAALVLACAIVIFAVGWWQGRQLATDASEPGANVASEESRPDDSTDSSTSTSMQPPAEAAPAGPVIAVPGAEIVTIVEDWRAYAHSGANVAVIERNRGAGEANWMTLGVLEVEQAPGGQGGLAIAYEIGEEAPNDFVGFNRRHVPSQDWRGATHLALWAHASDPAPELIVQFRESSGEVWRHTIPAAEIPSDGLLTLPLDDDTFARTDWSAPGNEAFDLTAVDQYGIYFGHVGPVVSGTLRIGPIAAVRH